MAKIAFAALNIKDGHLSDSEFLQAAENFAKKYNIFHGIYDEGHRYRIDLYFKDTVVMQEDINNWHLLIRSSDAYTMSVLTEKIYTSLYRLKRD